jgi:hypothetical protein
MFRIWAIGPIKFPLKKLIGIARNVNRKSSSCADTKNLSKIPSLY